MCYVLGFIVSTVIYIKSSTFEAATDKVIEKEKVAVSQEWRKGSL